MTDNALSIAKQLNPNQRLILVQVHVGDEVKPYPLYDRDDLVNKYQLVSFIGEASVHNWNLKLTPLGEQVAEVCALASYQSLTPQMAELLVKVGTPAYDPKNVERNRLSACALIRQYEKAKEATLTTLGRQVAALILMDGAPAAQPDVEPAPAADPAPIEEAAQPEPDAIDEEPTPILPAPPATPVDTDHLLTQAEELMLFQVLYNRPIRPRTPATRDTLAQLGLITVRSELMWEFALTPTGEAAAQRLELLDFVPVSDRAVLWRVLQGERIHAREVTDTPSHLKLVTVGEADDDNLGIVSLTEAGEYHAGRIVEYVAKKLMYNYPNRVQTLIKIYRSQEVSAHAQVSVNYLNDWGLTEGDTLTDFGRAVAAALQIMEPGYALADLTPPAQPVQTPADALPALVVEDETPAPDPVEEPQPETEDDPVEEEDPAPTDDDRAALLAEIETLRAALADANDALGSEWIKSQDRKMVSHKVGQLHKTTQLVLRGQSEAASKRAEKAEADNAALRAQLKAIKQVAAAPTTGDGDELATLRGHLSEVMSERDNLRAQLDEANLISTRNAREVFQTSRQLADALDAIKKHAEEADTATRRADRAESDLSTIQQTAQRWQAEHQAAITEAGRLNAIVEQLTAEIPAGHTIVTDATPAHLDRLTAEQRAILHMQFMPDGKLYVVAGPTQRPQPQPEKPAEAADHFVEAGNMVYDHPTEETEIIDEEEFPAPDPVGAPEPVYVFSEEPKFNNSLVGMLGKNTDEGGLHRAIAVAREFVRVGLWDGFTKRLVILDPYHVHDRLVFGLKPTNLADLVEGTHYQFVTADPQLLDHTTPDHAKQMVEMMRAGVKSDTITAEMNKLNEDTARAEFARRQAASFSNPPASRSGPPPRRLPVGK